MIQGQQQLLGKYFAQGSIVGYVVPEKERTIRVALHQQEIKFVDRLVQRIEVFALQQVGRSLGFNSHVSTFVIQTALEQVKRWHDSGLDPISVSVNISGAQLRDQNLVSDILTAIKRAELAPEYLDVEITETSVIESPQRARIALGQLRAAGITVSMDDFGIGYTSRALLADLPLDSV